MAATALHAAVEPSHRFYVGMAVTCAVIAFLGFTPTYWAPLAAGSIDEAPIVHLHAVLFSAWSLFFILQATLIANGRFAHHRAFGLAGISLATAMLLVGLATAIHSMSVQIEAGMGERARGFLIVPVTTILFFAAVMAVAIANRRRPEVHKRLIVLASVAILMAAVARLLRLALGKAGLLTGLPPIEFSALPAFATDLLIVAAIIHDWRTRGRPHPVYLVGGGLWLAIQFGRIPISKTPQWHAVADWLATFTA